MVFLGCFLLISKVFRGLSGEKILGFLEAFLGLFEKTKETKDREGGST